MKTFPGKQAEQLVRQSKNERTKKLLADYNAERLKIADRFPVSSTDSGAFIQAMQDFAGCGFWPIFFEVFP